MTRPRCVLQVSASDRAGGAEQISYNLHSAYNSKKIRSFIAVGNKQTDDPGVIPITNHAVNHWQRIFFALGDLISPLESASHRMARVRHWLRLIGHPKELLERYQGRENFEFSGAWRLIDTSPEKPDVLHCHNLHGNYFDLRAVPGLSNKVPLVLTLHDAWLLTGHCAHFFGCNRWKTGCGKCPDLTIPPEIRRDATAYNWQRKLGIYAASRLYVTTPSQWLMDKVEKSILSRGIGKSKVIPNGVDLSVFHPAEKSAARTELGIAQDVKLILFAANGIRHNFWKDYQTMQKTVSLVAESLPNHKILFIALGEDAPATQIGRAMIRFVPYQTDPKSVARYYQAADVYMHAAKVDTFPNVVLEALACGTPVVATAIGGIPEQLSDGVTGFLTPLGEAAPMAKAIARLCSDDSLLARIGRNASEDARSRFGIELQVARFLDWYGEVIEDWQAWISATRKGNCPLNE